MADPLERIVELKQSRQAHYAMADWTVQTDHLTLPEVCREVLRGRQYWLRSHLAGEAAADDPDHACDVVTATEHYPVFAGWGLLDSLGRRARDAGLSGNAWVVADASVFSLYGRDRYEQSAARRGSECRASPLPRGRRARPRTRHLVSMTGWWMGVRRGGTWWWRLAEG